MKESRNDINILPFELFLNIMLLIMLLSVFLIVRAGSEDKPFTSPVLPVNQRNSHLKFGGHEYYFGTSTKVNFFQAYRLCKLDGMSLVYIDSEAEGERLGIFATQIGHGHDHFWTSGNNLHDFQEWTWLSTGNIFRYTNWYPGEPNLGASGYDLTERCMEARTLDKGGFTWNNVPCERQYYYICKKGKDNCV